METKNYKVPMEIIIEVSQLLQKFGTRAELNGGDDEHGSVHLKVDIDPNSFTQQKGIKFIELMIDTFIDYRYSNDKDADYYKEAA
jgi:hypothetical protein